jgi:hypothetical protein
MPTHLGGDALRTSLLTKRRPLGRALTERPACFEIDPRGVRSSAPWCRSLAAHHHVRRSDRSPLHDVRQLAFKRSIDRTKANSMHGRKNRECRGATAAPHATWWSQTESNRRPPACKAGALPTELWPLQGTGISYQASGFSSMLLPIPDT